jgi:hypothetical protein
VEVKLRHVAALALVGWCLMKPMLRSGDCGRYVSPLRLKQIATSLQLHEVLDDSSKPSVSDDQLGASLKELAILLSEQSKEFLAPRDFIARPKG